MRFLLWLIVLALLLEGCRPPIGSAQNVLETPLNEKELIVLSAPQAGDPYYTDVVDDIFNFHIAYGRKIATHDKLLVLTDAKNYARYAKALGAQNVRVMPMQDIWMRDFGLSNGSNPVMFRYTSAGQGGGRDGQRDADSVQEHLATIIDQAQLDYQPSHLFNDGGNFVDDEAGRAVLSRKFLRDNGLSEKAARTVLRRLTGVQHIAFIEADEQGGLEHADGIVAFIGANTLVINSYPQDPEYAEQLHRDLKAGLPGVVLHEIITPYDGSQIYDDRFGSACGLYTNMLVTAKRIYFPQFGIPEDTQALKQIQAWSDLEIIPVRADQVCQMGGGVRCMSWQLRGENAALFRAHFKTSDESAPP